MSRRNAVPAWPVIGLTFEDDAAVADAAGVGDPIRVPADADLAAAAGAAAAAAARRLGVSHCRVQGIGPAGETWLMAVDTETETLEELGTGGPGARPHQGSSPVHRRLSSIPPRWWLVIGAGVVAAVAVAVVVVPRDVLPTPTNGGSVVVDTTSAAPEAGQLPVSAPTGWDTYARWVINAAKPGAAAVLAGRDMLVLVDGTNVFAVDVKSGRELWRSGTAGNVTSLYAPKNSDVIYAARSTTGVSVLDRATGKVLTNGEASARNIVLGDVPFAELPGQAGAVLVGRSWERRQVPATSVPVGTVREGLVSVSVEQSSLWVTTSDDPILPAAVTLQSPAEGLSLSRVVAFVDGRLILAWTDRLGPKVYTVDTVNETGRLTREKTFDATGRSSSKATVDAFSSLVGIGSLLLDLDTGAVTEAKQGTVTAQAGFGWTVRGGNDRVRISPDGTTLPLASGAVIPDVILPDGRAVVRAAYGSGGNAYYVLEVRQPSPAATASPSPSVTPAPSPTDGR